MKKRRPHHQKPNSGSMHPRHAKANAAAGSPFPFGKTFVLSLLITLLIAVGGSAILLALTRMENTMNSQSFTLFTVERLREGDYEVVTLNQEYEVTLSFPQETSEKLSQLETLLPSEIRAFCLSVQKFTDWMGAELSQRLSSVSPENQSPRQSPHEISD